MGRPIPTAAPPPAPAPRSPIHARQESSVFSLLEDVNELGQMRETYLRIFQRQLTPIPVPLPLEPPEPVRELMRSIFFEQDEVRHSINSCRNALAYFERMQHELDRRAVRLGRMISSPDHGVAVDHSPRRDTLPADAQDAASASGERSGSQPNPFLDLVLERRSQMVRRLDSEDAQAVGQATAQIRVERARLLTVATVADEGLDVGQSGSDSEDLSL